MDPLAGLGAIFKRGAEALSAGWVEVVVQVSAPLLSQSSEKRVKYNW